MRKWIVLVAMLLLAGCGQNSFWAYGDDDALGVRVGMEVAENVEAGISSMWWPDNDGDSQMYGGYAIYHLPADPNGILGTYVGAQTPLRDNYYNKVAPIAGIVFDEIFFLEYQYKSWESKESQEEDKIVFGIRLPF